MCEHCERAKRMIECFPADATVGDFRKTMLTLLHAAIPEGEEIPTLLALLTELIKVRMEDSGATLH